VLPLMVCIIGIQTGGMVVSFSPPPLRASP
jgi:hypothetical protein